MFPRITTVKQGNKTDQYLPIREKGKNQKRILGNLGQLDFLGNDLDGMADKVDYAQLLNDASEVNMLRRAR